MYTVKVEWAGGGGGGERSEGGAGEGFKTGEGGVREDR